MKKIFSGVVVICFNLPILLFYVSAVKTIEWWEKINIRPKY